MLDHVVTVVLMQPKDGQFAKALDQGGIQEIMDILALSQPARDALTYQEDDGTVKPLTYWSQGHAEETQDLCHLLPDKWCFH